jgi:beta-galactosidase
VLHLFPHWNWEGREGKEISVWCHTNVDSVELLLNGKSLGTKPVRKNSHLEWPVKYAPGTLEARGFKEGKLLLSSKRETAGPPAAIVAHADRLNLAADGKDVSVISVQIVDAEGRPSPMANKQVRFQITGPGRLIGLGNGNPSSHEPDKPESSTTGSRTTFNGLGVAFVQALATPGTIHVSAVSEGLSMGSVVLRAG